LAVYDYDPNGSLSFINTFPNSGKGIRSFLINAQATRLYTVNSASASISTYDLTEPRAPSENFSITLKLAKAGPPFVDAMGTPQTVTSQPFQVAFDDNQSHVYAISQRVTTNASDTAGNYLHVLSIDDDGGLSEPGEPIDLRNVGVGAIARPQGVVVY
jgi:6-phosphogluconolactonase (cycloisomerase 2 family)